VAVGSCQVNADLNADHAQVPQALLNGEGVAACLRQPHAAGVAELVRMVGSVPAENPVSARL
jgi:hypothetical protein